MNKRGNVVSSIRIQYNLFFLRFNKMGGFWPFSCGVVATRWIGSFSLFSLLVRQLRKIIFVSLLFGSFASTFACFIYNLHIFGNGGMYGWALHSITKIRNICFDQKTVIFCMCVCVYVKTNNNKRILSFLLN